MTIGSVLTVVCLFALLFYVHKVARAIVADNIMARVAHDLHENVHSMLLGQVRAVTPCRKTSRRWSTLCRWAERSRRRRVVGADDTSAGLGIGGPPPSSRPGRRTSRSVAAVPFPVRVCRPEAPQPSLDIHVRSPAERSQLAERRHRGG